MESEKPTLESATFRFTQEGNCVDGGYETLEIRAESSLGIDRDGGAFFVLKTKGWAISSTQDLQDLFNRINKVIQHESNISG